MSAVTVYSTKACPYCRMTKAFLDKLGVAYKNIDVGEDQDAAKRMIELSGQRGVPVTTVDNEVIVGFDSTRFKELFGATPTGEVYDVLVIGAGPAGLTAGVYCARKLLKTIILSENLGGQALESWSIENYMGYRIVTGEDLMKKFEEQVGALDVRLELDRVTAIFAEDNLFTIRTISGTTLRAKSLILTQGKKPRKLGVKDEDQYLGRGLSVCSTCDGPLYWGKRVVVVGGGNSALQTAVEMSSIASSVALIVRHAIRADPVYLKMFETKKNIAVYLDTEITGLVGDKFLTGITIKNVNGEVQSLEVDGVFIEIGWLPNTEIVADLVELNAQKEIIVDINCHTSQEGVFAAGDVTTIKGKQIIIAAGEGAKAALEAHEFLMKRDT